MLAQRVNDYLGGRQRLQLPRYPGSRRNPIVVQEDEENEDDLPDLAPAPQEVWDTPRVLPAGAEADPDDDDYMADIIAALTGAEGHGAEQWHPRPQPPQPPQPQWHPRPQPLWNPPPQWNAPPQQQNPTPPPEDLVEEADEATDFRCIICLVNKPNACFLPCRHASFCLVCANRLLNEPKKCPVCRRDVLSVERLFFSR
jgi:hypothetical protein